MGIIVQKYGGSSVADPEKVMAVARRVVATAREGHQVVVVVSAQGKTTDLLIAKAKEISPNPPKRELDMLLATGEQMSIALLAMAIHALGQPVISLTGPQGASSPIPSIPKPGSAWWTVPVSGRSWTRGRW